MYEHEISKVAYRIHLVKYTQMWSVQKFPHWLQTDLLMLIDSWPYLRLGMDTKFMFHKIDKPVRQTQKNRHDSSQNDEGCQISNTNQ